MSKALGTPIRCCGKKVRREYSPEHHSAKYRCRICGLDVKMRAETEQAVADLIAAQPLLAGLDLPMLNAITARYGRQLKGTT